MRLLFIMVALAVPSASSVAETPKRAQAPVLENPGMPIAGRRECRRPNVHPAEGKKGKFNRLGELPPGDLVLTVYRDVDGCPDPVIVRQGYGFVGWEPQNKPKAKRW